MKRLIFVLVLLVISISSLSYSYPGTCSPATDYLSCIGCASDMHQMCYATCGLSFKCKQECGEVLRQDYEDCQNHFGHPYPIVF